MHFTPVTALGTRPLDKDERMTLTFLTTKAKFPIESVVRDAYNLIKEVTKAKGLAFDVPLCLWLIMVGSGNRARILMLIHACAAKSAYTLKVAAREVFATDVPTNEAYVAAWEAQKDGEGKSLLESQPWTFSEETTCGQ